MNNKNNSNSMFFNTFFSLFFPLYLTVIFSPKFSWKWAMISSDCVDSFEIFEENSSITAVTTDFRRSIKQATAGFLYLSICWFHCPIILFSSILVGFDARLSIKPFKCFQNFVGKKTYYKGEKYSYWFSLLFLIKGLEEIHWVNFECFSKITVIFKKQTRVFL